MWYNLYMNKSALTKEELSQIPQEVLVTMYLELAGKIDSLSQQINKLSEQNALLLQRAFGRKTEKTSVISGQLMLSVDGELILNEAEVNTSDTLPKEPTIDVVYKRKKTVGKREADLSLIPVEETVEHTISEEELNAKFPNGYKELPPEIYSEVISVPKRLYIKEHRVHKYADKKEDCIVRAPKPERLLNNSVLSPSLLADIFEGKFVNSVPFNRLSEEYKRLDYNIDKHLMSSWCIQIYDKYLRQVKDLFWKQVKASKVIHCDETPFTCIDGRESGTKSYMWVYYSNEVYGVPTVYIYDYKQTRSKKNIEEILKDYKGTLMTDGYQVYRSLANSYADTIQVAGCWAHLKRKFAEILKSNKIKTGLSVAEEANARIAAIYHVDNMCKGKSSEDKYKNRQANVKPLVENFFVWAKETAANMDSSKVREGLMYGINAEVYLRLFLENPLIPLDNNAAERSIRTFCVGKKNWQISGSPRGAEASAFYYSLAETAKANKLKPREYLEYLLEQILIHVDDAPSTYMESIMPWSETLPDECKVTDKK